MAQNTRRNQSTAKPAPAKQEQEKPAEEPIVEEADDTTQAKAGSTVEDTPAIVSDTQGGGDSEASQVEPSASANPDTPEAPAASETTVAAAAPVAAPGGLLAKFVDPTTAPVEAAAAAAPAPPVKTTGNTIDAGPGDVQAIVVADVYSIVTTSGRRIYARKGDLITTSAEKVKTGITNRLLRKA